MIENRVLKAGGPVPPEFLCRLCQWCGADWNGACPVIFCQAPECPAGTVLDSRCRSCGMGPGGCDIEEHGCFEPCANAEDCEFGSCVNGTCEVGPCI
jgi:hypothetical protein